MPVIDSLDALLDIEKLLNGGEEMTARVIVCLDGCGPDYLEAAAVLAEEKGIEAVLTREAAAREYRLHPGRIGHLFVLADRDTVFGTLGAPREELNVRSHGSLHERAIHIYACGAGPLAVRPRSNPEVAAWLFSGLAKGSLS